MNLSRFKKYQIQNIKYTDRDKIVYVGRLDKCQKNINFLIKLSKYLNYQICVYGKGRLERKIKKQKNMKYCGVVDNKKVQNVFSKYLSSILVSNFEGASFSSIESLSSSTQCILRDTFLCAKTLTENNTGLLLERNLSPKKCAKKINSYLSKCNIKEQCDKAKTLAIKYYTDDQFEKK
ncbi:MAG: glycosyltransferase [Mycoplasmoidaceae bacterium]|nr:glycosyltransferase [Mycoplasmoidaceae bacterium]